MVLFNVVTPMPCESIILKVSSTSLFIPSTAADRLHYTQQVEGEEKVSWEERREERHYDSHRDEWLERTSIRYHNGGFTFFSVSL